MAQLKSTTVTGNLSVTGNALASQWIKLGGTSDDILLGNGATTSLQALKTDIGNAAAGNSWRPVKYDATTLNDTTTTLEFVAGSNIGLTFSNGKLTIANNYSYSLPLAADGTRGGVQLGFSATGAKLPVQVSSEKAYVELTATAITSVVTIPTIPSDNIVGTVVKDKIVLGNTGTSVKNSGVEITTTLGADDTTVPTSKAVAEAIGNISIPSLPSIIKSDQTWQKTDSAIPTTAALETFIDSKGFTTNTGTVTGSSLTANNVILGNGNSAIKATSKMTITDKGITKIDSSANTNYTDPILHLHGYGAQTSADTAKMVVISGYTSSPYGLVMRQTGDGSFSLQAQRIAKDSETFVLKLNPNGGTVKVGGNLMIANKATWSYNSSTDAMELVWE